jgi:hypothetical protein
MQCPHCTVPLRWEYKDCTIPLDGLETAGPPDRLSQHGGDLPADLVDAYDIRVLRQLRREADDGWEPAEATDFAAMWATGRVQFRQRCRAIDLLFGSTTYAYRSVTLRLRRLDRQVA